MENSDRVKTTTKHSFNRKHFQPVSQNGNNNIIPFKKELGAIQFMRETASYVNSILESEISLLLSVWKIIFYRYNSVAFIIMFSELMENFLTNIFTKTD